MSKFKVGGLFSGVGGIELGFEKAGFEISWSNEIDKYACATYRANHKHQLYEEDIRDFKNKKLPSVDILTGGFPCQAFSVAGYRKGFNDDRGNMFFEIMDLINNLKTLPKVLVLENVKNLTGHDQGNTRKVIERTLRESFNYSVIWEVMNTSEYTEIPHNRERTVIVCFKDENGLEMTEGSKSYKYKYLKFPKKAEKTKGIQEFLDKDVDEKFYYRQDKYMYKELAKVIKNPNTAYQYRRVYVRENKNNQVPTLTANMGTGGHNVPLIKVEDGIRKLTPSECFRFQGFKNIKLPKELPNSQFYKQAGNAVTVDLFNKIANSIKSVISN